MSNIILYLGISLGIIVYSFFTKLSLNFVSPITKSIIDAYVFSIIAPALFLYTKVTNISVDFAPKGVLFASFSAISLFCVIFLFSFLSQKIQISEIVQLSSIFCILLIVSIAFGNESLTIRNAIGIITILIGCVLVGK